MPRLPDPPEVAQIKNSARTHPERYRNQIPKSTAPIGQYPADPATDPEACWFELVKHSTVGVFTGADRIMLEIASNLLADYRKDPKGFSSAKLKDLIGCLARFGMSPSDRNKLGVAKLPEENPYSKLDD